MSKAAELAALIGSGQAQGDRNFIDNGAFNIFQRATSATGVTSESFNSADRFRTNMNDAGTFTVSQSDTVPAGQGFNNSLKLDCTTADASVAADSYLAIDTRIEAQNLQRLCWGTSSAKNLTMSFWVRSNLTGTYVLEFLHGESTQYNNNTYTIDSANTWEKKTITITGDTTTAINDDNGLGLALLWWLQAGSTFNSGTTTNNTWHSTQANRAAGLTVALPSSTDNEWYITGIQLEIGDVATPFEHEDIGTTLRKCQRYYQSVDHFYSSGSASVNAFYYTPLYFPINMRATPTMTASAWNSNTGNATSYHSSTLVNGWILVSAASTAVLVRGNHTNSYNLLAGRGKFDAEL